MSNNWKSENSRSLVMYPAYIPSSLRGLYLASLGGSLALALALALAFALYGAFLRSFGLSIPELAWL